jgi:hypothetical protein
VHPAMNWMKLSYGVHNVLRDMVNSCIDLCSVELVWGQSLMLPWTGMHKVALLSLQLHQLKHHRCLLSCLSCTSCTSPVVSGRMYIP